jgi:hypothetical protein
MLRLSSPRPFEILARAENRQPLARETASKNGREDSSLDIPPASAPWFLTPSLQRSIHPGIPDQIRKPELSYTLTASAPAAASTATTAAAPLTPLPPLAALAAAPFPAAAAATDVASLAAAALALAAASNSAAALSAARVVALRPLATFRVIDGYGYMS